MFFFIFILFMHQSFVTMVPIGPGNSVDIAGLTVKILKFRTPENLL